MAELDIEQCAGGIQFTAKIVPGASKTAICGVMGCMLKIKVAAPPEKGKANQGVIQVLARQLGLKRGDVSIVSGQTSPIKRIQVVGLTEEQLRGKLARGPHP